TISVPMTPRMTRVVVLSIGRRPLLDRRLRRRRPRLGLEDAARPVGHDLGHRAGELGAVEAHRHDRIAAHQRRVLHEAVERLAAGVLEERRVLGDLAATDRAEAGDEVAREPTAPDDEPERLALRLDDAMAGN